MEQKIQGLASESVEVEDRLKNGNLIAVERVTVQSLATHAVL